MTDAVAVAVNVALGVVDGVNVALAVMVGVAVFVTLAVAVSVGVAVAVGVALGTGVSVAVGEAVTVFDGVNVRLGVRRDSSKTGSASNSLTQLPRSPRIHANPSSVRINIHEVSSLRPTGSSGSPGKSWPRRRYVTPGPPRR